MKNDKYLSNLGLAMRAGKLVSGEEMVIDAVRSGQAKLVIVAEDASEGTFKKVNDKCSYYGVPIQQYGRRDQLGASIGKETRVVIAVTDAGFARMLKQ
ncbi:MULTISPECIES: YlxQ family RNA-binding protein [unclassified Paenibacillus]|uniref:YlxQ family RNA-binding protein n=1 Tax=unclassified Paenibacillus TaxID=185978 RepID=UPI001AE3DCA7|nr:MULTISPECIES: YlxQ family RNA-binding protein [unclassified Paenibacillus]MBP1155964.1 ribosomal protein L7Ae-like RNA K-turn-binding protein [Paenibacillus sp. PvP091]MBP1168650.1 ribosomal protein L7Ae-like RNA K-turn-binding protein [Paenibacillus sp. PvR098]MBP2439678.1 ribosomal protein L7Ae-like RNA K-turn-binding protein [Paenibacillus sp. PvP052]